jgi:hypothetical protein
LITVENYEKWYNLYIIQPTGEVEIVPTGVIDDYYPGRYWVDHVWHPALALKVAKHLGGEVPATSLEVIAGRWVLKRELIEEITYELPE